MLLVNPFFPYQIASFIKTYISIILVLTTLSELEASWKFLVAISQILGLQICSRGVMRFSKLHW